MELSVDTKALSEATREVMGISELFKRAERSALKSTGWMIRNEMRGFIESSGRGTWAGYHPLTLKYKKKFKAREKEKYKKGSVAWGKVDVKKRLGPLYWLGKQARYRVAGDEASVGFGFSHSGGEMRTRGDGTRRKLAPASMDPFLMNVIGRAEEGEVTNVTKAMRRFFGLTRSGNQGWQEAGFTMFPLKRSTSVLETPKRPIFDPVMARVQDMIAPHFENQFWQAIERYRFGLKNKGNPIKYRPGGL